MRQSGPGATARAFHESTKHSYESVRRSRHFLDWDNRPSPFKVYEGVPRLPLPEDLPAVGIGALDAIAAVEPSNLVDAPDLAGLARILFYGAGVIRTRTFADGTEYHFRTYACAGALYPVELYVVCGDLQGLAAGVYHLDPKAPALERLREGDHRGHLVRATAAEPAVSAAPIVLVLTGIPWRTTWKYTDRGYRHLFWDSGMILANVLALAASARLPARVILGFVDEEVASLLGLDGRAEFPLCLVPVGRGAPAPVASAAPPPVTFRTRPLSAKAIDYPAIAEVNDAGRLVDADAVRAWRARTPPREPRPATDGGSPAAAAAAPDALEAVIRRRGSARSFGPGLVPAGILTTILARATRGVPTDLAPRGLRLLDVYLIAAAVDGLPSGAYVYADGRFARLREGNFRREAGYLCLEQPLAAQAAATHFLMSDLSSAWGALGDRGYRVAQLQAGIVAGKMYLGAYAYRLGATGLTFYDDAVAAFFSPHAAGKDCMLVMVLGESTRRLT